MRDVELAILRLLDDVDIWLTPNNIAKNTGYVSGYVGPVCKEMVDDELLEADPDAGDPFYRITDGGREELEEYLEAHE